MINRISVAITLLILFSLASCSKDDSAEKGPVIGEIGSEVVYLYDLIPEGKFPSFSRKNVDFRKNRLKIYLKNKMYSKEGFSRGLHITKSVQEKLTDYIDKNMAKVVYKKVVLEKYANENSLRELYEHLKKRVSARHILISYNGTSGGIRKVNRTKTEALNLLNDLRQKIVSKDDFITYAIDLSEDQTSSDGGNLGFFEWGHMEDSFQETAFSLEPNTVSEPVETSYGFHLIWVDSVKTVDLKPFEQMQVELKNKIYAIYRKEINLTSEKFIASLNVAANTKFHDANFIFLLKKITEFNSSNNKNVNRQSQIDFLQSIELPGHLLTYLDNGAEKSISSEPIINLIKNPSLGWTIDKITYIQIIKNILKDETTARLIKEYGFRSKYEEDDDFLKDLKKKEQDFMKQELTKTEVVNKVIPDSENLLTYYNEHKDRYVSSGVSDIVEILISEKSLIDSLYILVSIGQDMSELASSFSERKNVKKNRGILHDISRDKLPPIGKTVASMDIGEVSKPLKVGTKWSFFKVISKSPPRYKPFENVMSLVSIDFKRDETKLMRAIFEDYLNDKYEPKYYFDKFIPELVEGKVE